MSIDRNWLVSLQDLGGIPIERLERDVDRSGDVSSLELGLGQHVHDLYLAGRHEPLKLGAGNGFNQLVLRRRRSSRSILLSRRSPGS